LEPVVNNKESLNFLNNNISSLNYIQEQFPLYADKIEYELLEAHLVKLEKDIEDKKREQRNLEGEITQSEEQQKQLIAQKASLN
ncbi:hypothetical protein ABTM15_20180, partial [Acinetobacter baumannii]